MFARNDASLSAAWWWTIDKTMLGIILSIILVGIILIFAASPPVAENVGLPQYYFVVRHFIYLFIGMCLMLIVSMLRVRDIKLLAIVGFVACICLMALVLLFGNEYKGARRWITILGFSLQPSEFLKPLFIVFTAFIFSKWQQAKTINEKKRWVLFAIGSLFLSLFILIKQPDLGMSFLLTSVWLIQVFFLGFPIVWFFMAGVLGIIGLVGAYLFLPHVTKRVDGFLNPNLSDKWGQDYQISQSLEAINNGGFMGMGPGEGIIKKNLPDSHADFIFAVAGEEFGAIFCIFIIALFVILVLRGISKSYAQGDLFSSLSIAGISIGIGLQAFINIASSLRLIPTKGMTIPLISYGGSSILATCLGLGMLLALSRRRVGL